MPKIRAFKGLRYDTSHAGDIEDLVAPPYDIIYDEWRDKLYDRNPHNIIRLIKTREEREDTTPDDKYERAGRHVDDWIDNGMLTYEDKPAIYVRAETYDIKGETRTRYGFIGLLHVEQFGNGVYPHERTLSGPKADRMKLVKATKTNLSQIFSIYRDPENTIRPLLESVVNTRDPEHDFVDEQGVRRRLWLVTDPAFIDSLVGAMRDRDIIIADGHHRYETALAYKEEMEAGRQHQEEPFDYVSMYFANADDHGTAILPTHRKIHAFDRFDREAFLAVMDEHFDIKFVGERSLEAVLEMIADGASENNIYGMYMPDGYRIARYRKPSSPKDLDVDLLHNLIIENLLGISREEIAEGKYVHFSKSAEHAVEDIDSGKDQVCFLLNAVTPGELFRKVLQGVRMPQKSTYFYPKTLSGLVMYRLVRESIE